MATLLVDKRESEFESDGLSPDEEIRLRNDLGKLAVNLIKAILQTSFYRTKHKQTQKSIDEVFSAVDPLRDFFHEITLQATADESKPDFTLEGVFAEPVQLSTCIKSVLRDEFIVKLRDFFVYNKLVSLSFQETMDREQFTAFLSLATRKLEFRRLLQEQAMGREEPDIGETEETFPLETAEPTPIQEVIEPGGGSGGESDPAMRRSELLQEQLSDLLLAAGVHAVSCICRDELVFVDRQLPWRVKLALSRMMKNLKDLPLYSKASRREIQEAKTLLLKEIIRPLRGQDMLMQFLLNCDLVTSVSRDLEDLDVEGEILGILNRGQLRMVSSCFLRELHRLAGAGEPDDPALKAEMDKAVVLLRKCALPLSDVIDEESMGIFRRAVKDGWIAIEELPESVQKHLEIERSADEFLENPEENLRVMADVATEEAFRARTSSASLLAAELMHRRVFVWAKRIVDMLDELAGGKRDVPPAVRTLAADNLDTIATPENFARMVAAMKELRPGEQQALFALCDRFRKRAVPYVIRELQGDLPEPTRHGICAALQQMKSKEVNAFVRQALGRVKQPPLFYRDLLGILGNVKDPKGYQIAQEFLGDEEPVVRAAAYTAVARIGVSRAERELMRGLMDPDTTVRNTVVEHLGEIGSDRSEFLDFLRRLMEGRYRPGLGDRISALFKRTYSVVILAHLRLLFSGSKALVNLAESGFIEPEGYEQGLARSLSIEASVRLLQGGEEAVALRAQVVANLITALRHVGTARSLATLRNVRDNALGDEQMLATTAIREIKLREGIDSAEKWYARVFRWLRALLPA